MKELHLAFLIYATQTAPKTQLDDVMAEVLAVTINNEEDFADALKLSKIIGMDLQILAKAAVKKFGEDALKFKELVDKELKQGDAWEKFVKRFARLYRKA